MDNRNIYQRCPSYWPASQRTVTFSDGEIFEKLIACWDVRTIESR